MKFYVAKMIFSDGDLAHPHTVFASSYAEAVKRFESGDRGGDFSEIIVRERPVSEAAHYRRDPAERNNPVTEHPNVEWHP